MFKSCPTRDHRRGLLIYLFGHLKETAKSFCLRADLKPTEPVWGETRNPEPWGKPLGKDIVFWAAYPHAPDAISPHQDAGVIFDFRSWRTFRAADYPEGRTADGTVQKTTIDTQPAPEKKEILTGPIPDPEHIELEFIPE